jgi:hypothetical protein
MMGNQLNADTEESCTQYVGARVFVWAGGCVRGGRNVLLPTGSCVVRGVVCGALPTSTMHQPQCSGGRSCCVSGWRRIAVSDECRVNPPLLVRPLHYYAQVQHAEGCTAPFSVDRRLKVGHLIWQYTVQHSLQRKTRLSQRHCPLLCSILLSPPFFSPILSMNSTDTRSKHGLLSEIREMFANLLSVSSSTGLR